MEKSQTPHTFRLHLRQTHQINIKMASKERMTPRSIVGEVIPIHTRTANLSVQASRKMGKSGFLLLVRCVSLHTQYKVCRVRFASDEARSGYTWNLRWFVVRNDQGVLGIMSNKTWPESGLTSGNARVSKTRNPQMSLGFHKPHSKGGSPNMRWSRYVNTGEALASAVETRWWPMNRTLPALVHHEHASLAENLLSRGSRFWA
jgi:hypothetical protein